MRLIVALLAAFYALGGEQYALLQSWSVAGEGPGQLRDAHGIDVNRNGDVLVTDSRASRVTKYTPDGKFLSEIGDGPGSGQGQFRSPRDAAVSPVDGKIYVADGANLRILGQRQRPRRFSRAARAGSRPAR